jgi:coenzyme F420 hydrogenase subunit beta
MKRSATAHRRDLPIMSIEHVVRSRLCHGCGACSYACTQGAIELKNFIEIGIRPVVDTAKCNGCQECVSVCSGLTLQHDESLISAEIQSDLRKEWGPVLELWEGHAVDEEIWFKGGSGGVATALGVFAIEQLNYAGVLHVGMDPNVPYLNDVVLSTERSSLVHRAGSRYAPAAVCGSLGEIEKAERPCVLIGKPCDIASANMASRIRPKLNEKIGFTIAIFCGGTPSTRGTLELLKVLGVNKEEVESLRYRGHGWPGMTGVNLKSSPDGTRVEMTYSKAWDTILTRYKPFRCQICPDGTGEFADIACGDPWYREIEEGERGSTLIVVRTERGRTILREAIERGYIAAKRCSNNILPKSQLGLLNRRRSVFPKLMGLAITRVTSPTFSGFYLFFGWRKHKLGMQFSSLFRGLRWAFGLKRKGCLALDREGELNQVSDTSKRVG